MVVVVKTCTKCRDTKPLADFPRGRRMPLGRYPSCKRCKADAMRAQRQREPEHVRQVRRASHERHRERVNAERREARAADPEPLRERDRARWPKRKPGARAYNRLAARRRRVGVDEQANVYAESVLAHDPCAYCGAPAEHADHIDAIAAGGANTWGNLTAACASCNFSKATLPLLRFLLRRAA